MPSGTVGARKTLVGETWNVKSFDATAPRASVAFSVRETAPAVVGVPEIVVSAALKLRPAGSVPVLTSTVTGALPPLTSIFCEYAKATVASASVAVLNSTAG